MLSAILAAVMLTLSRQLPACSSAIIEDLYKTLLRKHASQERLVRVGRVTVLVMALVAAVLAAGPENRVLDLVSYAWAGFGTVFDSVALFSVIWSRTTRNDTLAKTIIGALTVTVWRQLGWLGLCEIIPGSIFGSTGIVAFSLLSKAPPAAMQRCSTEAGVHYHLVPPLRLQES